MRNKAADVTSLRGQPQPSPIAHLLTDHATEVKHCFFRNRECARYPAGGSPYPNGVGSMELGGGPAPSEVVGSCRRFVGPAVQRNIAIGTPVLQESTGGSPLLTSPAKTN